MAAGVTGIILAGGRSTRFGSDKALLDIGGLPVIAHVIETLSRFAHPVFVVTSGERFEAVRAIAPGCRVIKDIIAGCGPLGGIHTGLLSAKSRYSFVVGCDMPFVDAGLAACLISVAAGADAAAPKMGGIIHPLQAVYSVSCLPAIEEMLREHRLQTIRLFERVCTRFVTEEQVDALDPGRLSFFNINTREDLARARALWEERTKKTAGRQG